ncbi:MAG: class I SAM-dependent methyltransferase [Nitrososphaeraceae archaeon]
MTFTYDPSKYWLERGKIYQKNFRYSKNFRLQEKVLEEYLKKNVFTSDQNISSVLELGCGFGRITKILLDNFHNVEEYLAVDLSPHQIENARNYLSDYSNKITFLNKDIQSLDLHDKKYDLVILSEVLLHVLPSEIEFVIEKIISLSKKHVINIDWYEELSPSDYNKKASHNFIHDYESLYKKHSQSSKVTRIPILSKKLFRTINTKQSLFHVNLNDN